MRTEELTQGLLSPGQAKRPKAMPRIPVRARGETGEKGSGAGGEPVAGETDEQDGPRGQEREHRSTSRRAGMNHCHPQGSASWQRRPLSDSESFVAASVGRRDCASCPIRVCQGDKRLCRAAWPGWTQRPPSDRICTTSAPVGHRVGRLPSHPMLWEPDPGLLSSPAGRGGELAPTRHCPGVWL